MIIRKTPSIESGRRFSVKIKNVLFELGNVYSYNYIPISKDTLKFYDRTPLVLFMEYQPRINCIFGVNLHFLPIDERQDLVDGLLEAGDSIRKTFKWELIFKDPRFRNLPIGFRKYKLDRMNGISKVVDISEDVNVNREDLKITQRIRSERGFRYNQSMADKMNRLAMRNKDWRDFLKSI